MIYVGKIVVPAGAGRNNLNTADPFELPPIQPLACFLSADTDGLLFECRLGDEQTTAATGAPLGAANLRARVLTRGNESSVAVWNPGLSEAVVKVYREI